MPIAQHNTLDTQLTFVGVICTNAGYEYFLTEMPDVNGYFDAYVMGQDHANGEFGSNKLDQLVGNITAMEFSLSDDIESEHYAMPPVGFNWLCPSIEIA